ncbi:MAG: SMC-Scp complex subunit ScpB [Candidatus Pacearchaeota archaeon]|jgi:segregation and condensation protein B
MEIVTKETLDEIDNSQDLENLKKVEAALFVSGKFLTTQELVTLTDLNPILLEHSLSVLADKYNENSAIEIVRKGELWKMDVRKEHIDIVNRLATGSEEFSKAEQETLAAIAHKNPVNQSKIIQMRGNKAYDHVKRFLELGLIKSKKAGRTKELSLSDEFYDYFNVGKEEKSS